MTLVANIQSTFSNVIGRQLDNSNNDPSSFGIKVMIPRCWEMESSFTSYAALKLATRSSPNSPTKYWPGKYLVPVYILGDLLVLQFYLSLRPLVWVYLDVQ